ncbi:hypothetical protein MXB_4681 [Myxobolus squamalis]|nr:hypothetical protein MXB_4681 [Myxobolus squamalis]
MEEKADLLMVQNNENQECSTKIMQLPYLNALSVFDGNLNELCGGMAEKCFSCSISMWSRNVCHNYLVPCENLQEYEAFNGRDMLRGTKNKLEKNTLFNDIINDDGKIIHNEIIAIFFNTISQTMFKNGATAISK